MIQVNNISKSFGRMKAVDNVSFEVGEGGVVGFLGPNGAGKTTTMRIITGYLAADQGDVLVNNLSISRHPTEVQKLIGYLPENNPLYKNMLAAEFLEFSARIKGSSPDSLSFVVAATGIGDVYYRPIGELSKGYRQRVGLAATLLGDPKVLILDEPTEGLDPNQRSEIRSLIRELAKDRTIIMSTHVMQEATAVCDRLLVINHGQLVADGTPEELSHSARGEKVFVLELEGGNVVEALRSLEAIQRAEVTPTNT